MSFPVVRDQFFYPIYLSELIDWGSYVVREYVKGKKSAREVVDALIRDIRYPFWMGNPDDSHTLNMYHGEYKWCKRIDEDFWDKGSMVVGTNMVADCDGSAIATVTCLRAFGVKPENVYVVFGVVRDAATRVVLGGHAWTVTKDASFQSDKFVLCEMTLDTPPSQYPEVGLTLEDLKKPFRYGTIEYDPQAFFNDQAYVELEPITLGRKDTHAKHEAIERAWGVESKYLKALRRSRVWRLKRALGLAR
jgi:hypothetical protein